MLLLIRVSGTYYERKKQASLAVREIASRNLTSDYQVMQFLDKFYSIAEAQIYKEALVVVTARKVASGLKKGQARRAAEQLLESPKALARNYKTATTPQVANRMNQALRAKTIVKMGNNIGTEIASSTTKEGIVNPVRLEKSVTKALRGKAQYRNALLDTVSEQMSYTQNGIYNTYSSFGLWKSHRWTVVNPQDQECIVAAGQIVVVGEPFANGLVSPPVHPNCFCRLIPER